MFLRNSEAEWGGLGKLFHWLVFALIGSELLIADYMEHPPFGLESRFLFMLHKSVGLVVIGVVLARIVWRLSVRAPGDMPGPALQHSAQRLTHLGLYGVMFMVPFSGYVMSVAGGKMWLLFGQWAVPNLVGIDPALKMLAHKAHFFFVDVLWCLVALHVGAVFYHLLAHGDAILRRMLPGYRRGRAA